MYIHKQEELFIVVSYSGNDELFTKFPGEITTTMPQWQNLPRLQQDLENANPEEISKQAIQELMNRVYLLRPSNTPMEYRSLVGSQIYCSMAERFATILNNQRLCHYQPHQPLCQRIATIFKSYFECFTEGKKAFILADIGYSHRQILMLLE